MKKRGAMDFFFFKRGKGMSRDDGDEALSGSVPAQYGNKKHVVIRTATEMRSVHTRFIRTDIPDNELHKKARR